MTLVWALAAAAEIVAYDHLVTYEQQRALGAVHRLRSPMLRALYPALGVSDLRDLLLRYVVWLMIPGFAFAITWFCFIDRRPPSTRQAGGADS